MTQDRTLICLLIRGLVGLGVAGWGGPWSPL